MTTQWPNLPDEQTRAAGRVLMYSKPKRAGVSYGTGASSPHACRRCGAHAIVTHETDGKGWRKRCQGTPACAETRAKRFEELWDD